MSQDMFIKIDGIEGESLDANHKTKFRCWLGNGTFLSTQICTVAQAAVQVKQLFLTSVSRIIPIKQARTY